MEAGRCLEPRAVLLLVTVLITVLTSSLLCTSIMTDHWEHIDWDRDQVVQLTAQGNITEDSIFKPYGHHTSIEWHMEGRVSKISLRKRTEIGELGKEVAGLFLLPMHGGIWTLCPALAEELRILKKMGLPDVKCVNYLDQNAQFENEFILEDIKGDWQHRMQNLSISCALVCLIILGSSALVGLFGVVKHQISAVLVTGVMYLLAGTFALFTLTIIHFKRRSECQGRGNAEEGALGTGNERLRNQLRNHYLPAREVAGGWSLELGWAALALCTAASALWILLARVMRYSPLTTILA
ncbi:uncharacterized protein isoform X2 [Rhodnius prolixus]|uniref:uncharacterized protein isoform X2 n=1 Tax=Rhodnius prolixus TaxID=13249 RepID=UPI003D1897A4